MDVISFAKNLSSRNLMPENIQIAEWRSWTLVSCNSGINSKFISESVSQGIDKNPNVALAKALTEFLERKLSKESSDEVVRLTERSDGFAAFPKYHSLDKSEKMAAQNAKDEAIERFLWAKWWDDVATPYTIRSCVFPEVKHIKSEFSLKSAKEIIVSTETHCLIVLLAENEHGGFVTGGAAGKHGSESAILTRAFGELLRHLIVIQNMFEGDRTNLSFYEGRLWGFGSGEWSELVLSRLSTQNEGNVLLPALVVNQSVSHSAMDLISIHRCLFENQPVFIGGPLERLCI